MTPATASVAADRRAAPMARRMRVALGTLIAIEAAAGSVQEAQAAVEEAFSAISRLQTLLHPAHAGSDLALINTSPPGIPVAIAQATCELLRLAFDLHALTAGVFDPCLPQRPGRLRDLELLTGHRLIAHAPVAIDFGGFAKGYAVDVAIAALAARACSAGLVNAGGDLRAFGPQPYPVLLRGADDCFEPFELADSALAVSDAGSQRHPIEHQGYYNRAVAGSGVLHRHAAVRAPTATLADALCKCVMLCPEPEATRILKLYGAVRVTFR